MGVRRSMGRIGPTASPPDAELVALRVEQHAMWVAMRPASAQCQQPLDLCGEVVHAQVEVDAVATKSSSGVGGGPCMT